MFLNTLKNKKNSFSSKAEEGFTLIELIIVVVIIGILASIALLVAGGQQRQAIIASVKHDVKANSAIMAPGSGTHLYTDAAVFVGNSARTDLNVTTYNVSPSFRESCTDTTRTFGPGDVVVWRLLTSVGKIEPLACPDLLGDKVTINDHGVASVTAAVATPPTTGGGTGGTAGGTGGGGAPVNGNSGNPTDPITPANGVTTIVVHQDSNETYRVCYSVVISTTSSATPVPWAFKIDKNMVPFVNNFIEGDGGDSRFVRVDRGDGYWLVTGTGALAAASLTNTITFGGNTSFCTKAPNNNAVIADYLSSYPSTIAAPVGGSWYGTQDFTVSNSSPYYSGWKVQVDITNLRNVVNSRPTDMPRVDTNLTITQISGNIYEIRGDPMYRAIMLANPYTFTVRIG